MTVSSLPLFARIPAVRYTLWGGLMAAIFLLFALISTPLRIQNGYDSLIFQLMGETWLNGGIPYMDFFDHKGPALYLIQMAWMSLGMGKWGLFALEVLFGIVSCELMYRCGRASGVSPWPSMAGVLTGILLLSAYVDCGNTVEEWSLPFQVAGLLITIRILMGKCHRVTAGAYVMGACFGIVAMMRLNNDCIISGCLIGLTIFLIGKRQYAVLAKCALSFCAGVLTVVLPLIAYFLYHGALGEMLHANLLFNINYSNHFVEEVPVRELLFNAARLVPCVVLPPVSYLYDRRNGTTLFPSFCAVSVIIFILFIKGAGFPHYYQMVIPAAALAVQLASRISSRRWISSLVAFLLIAAPVVYLYPARWYWNWLTITEERRTSLEKAPSHLPIPNKDYDGIYTWGTHENLKRVYYTFGKRPTAKYTFMQEVFMRIDPTAAREIADELHANPPQWIISDTPLEESRYFPADLSEYSRIASDSLPTSLSDRCVYRRR